MNHQQSFPSIAFLMQSHGDLITVWSTHFGQQRKSGVCGITRKTRHSACQKTGQDKKWV